MIEISVGLALFWGTIAISLLIFLILGIRDAIRSIKNLLNK